MTIVKVGGKEYNLDPDLLKFNEHSINEYLQAFAVNYNVFQQAHSDAQFLRDKFKDLYEKTYAEKFIEFREQVKSDKSCDLICRTNVEICSHLENLRIAERNEVIIKGFLRSLEKSFESAQSFSHNLRRELSMIYGVK